MSTEALKSTAIQNLDAPIPVRATAGQGGFDRVQRIIATITPKTGETSTSTYQFVRIPSNAVLQKITMWLDAAMTTFTGNLGLYYSDNWADGTDAEAGQGAVSASCFQATLALATITSPTEYLLGGAITSGLLNTPAWKMGGLTSDPGGFFDIVFSTTTTNSGSQPVNMVVEAAIQGGNL